MPTRKGKKGSYRVFRLTSWEAFLKLVAQAPYSNWAFRGERDERWPLYSSLSRYLKNFGVDHRAWSDQESRILRVFKRKAHQFLAQPPEPDDDFQWLALMQHHGAPPVDRFHLVAVCRRLLCAGADAERRRGVGDESGCHR